MLVRKQLFFQVVLLFLLLPLTSTKTTKSKSTKKCGDLSTISVSDECSGKWKDMKERMHPTQPTLGFAWVEYKLNNYISSKSEAQKELNEKIVPVCKGPENDVWILDHHHVLAALDLSTYSSTKITIHIVCDYSSVTNTMEDFWNKMIQNEMTYLMIRQPTNNYASLPSFSLPWEKVPWIINFNATQTSFIDDPWRSLVGFSRKIESNDCIHKYCDRAFIKSCDKYNRGIPFFEFRWSYFFNDAYYQGCPSSSYKSGSGSNTGLWLNCSSYFIFKKKFELMVSKKLIPGQINTATWKELAPLLVPLARSMKSAGNYIVPASQGGCSGKLPGFVNSTSPITNEDPNCELPICSDFPPSLFLKPY